MQTITESISENSNKDGEHILMSLTYIGKNNEENSGIELARTLEHWRRYLMEMDVSSAVAINDHYFIQSLEGSRPAINEVLAKLINEYLSVLPHIVEVEEIEVRKWSGYLIKYLTSSAEDEEYTLKSFSAGADFNPYLMKQNQITSFMQSIFEEKGLTISKDSDIN
ncbi:BLUF domain-containing protein [Psychrobacter aquaticus]|uniref:BLUF domain-containing protein n=1 Tax=Psychrobacter aquaticus CMS 56 TaxID=1354303 RepID=U4T755_9GAMM|nr:BLUF domain-containing protein [Psychrobacter aquaticus]ERL54328.1 hypothetical protein M917_2833 [Psychrobacter aquaticus CMS 56]